jgi:hypothetical protein
MRKGGKISILKGSMKNDFLIKLPFQIFLIPIINQFKLISFSNESNFIDLKVIPYNNNCCLFSGSLSPDINTLISSDNILDNYGLINFKFGRAVAKMKFRNNSGKKTMINLSNYKENCTN